MYSNKIHHNNILLHYSVVYHILGQCLKQGWDRNTGLVSSKLWYKVMVLGLG